MWLFPPALLHEYSSHDDDKTNIMTPLSSSSPSPSPKQQCSSSSRHRPVPSRSSLTGVNGGGDGRTGLFASSEVENKAYYCHTCRQEVHVMSGKSHCHDEGPTDQLMLSHNDNHHFDLNEVNSEQASSTAKPTNVASVGSRTSKTSRTREKKKTKSSKLREMRTVPLINETSSIPEQRREWKVPWVTLTIAAFLCLRYWLSHVRLPLYYHGASYSPYRWVKVPFFRSNILKELSSCI